MSEREGFNPTEKPKTARELKEEVNNQIEEAKKMLEIEQQALEELPKDSGVARTKQMKIDLIKSHINELSAMAKQIDGLDLVNKDAEATLVKVEMEAAEVSDAIAKIIFTGEVKPGEVH